MATGIITPIVNIRPHPNADRLVLGSAAGYQVIVGLDTVEGTLGIFIPCDMQLSLEMCRRNNLHRHANLNIDPKAKTGFFDDNRRVRTQKFRGEISEGFWCSLSFLAWTGINFDKLKQGKLVSELNGELVCSKYYTPATRRAMGISQGKGKQSRKTQLKLMYPTFLEHYDTPQLRMAIKNIPKGAILNISEKCHGTSGRTGYLQEQKPMNWFKKRWNAIIGKFGLKFEEYRYRYVSGTRRVTIDPDLSGEIDFYAGKQFRNKVHENFKGLLHPGETVYYEILGYDEQGGLIMGAHNIVDNTLKKVYGGKMVYSYGCKPGECKVVVYRITRTLVDGDVEDLSWSQMVNRCDQLGFAHVPMLAGPIIYDGDSENLSILCEKLSRGNSTLDEGHIKEGVVVRVESQGRTINYKYKSWIFCDLEGIAKNSDNYVDIEDIF